MLTRTIIGRTLRVPRSPGGPGDGAAVARQLDAVLAGAGFTCSGELLQHVTALEPGAAMDLAVDAVGAVRELVGDHVEHNAYFIDFPAGVPDTVEFWVSCLRDAVGERRSRWALRRGRINLLDLPRYGRYQHTYAELLAAHDELVAAAGDRVTVLHLGGPAADERRRLFETLATSTVPLGEADLDLLGRLAEVEDAPPVSMRENRAVINASRLLAGRPLVGVDTVTDVLRIACGASHGDVTLSESTRFRSMGRPQRRLLLGALDAVVAADPGKLADVTRHARRWKRLGERLHPHEYPQFPHAAEVFAVARGERRVPSLASRAEAAFAAGDPLRAASVLTASPGMLLRSLDHLLRTVDPAERPALLDTLASVVSSVSGRVLLSVREHVANRATQGGARMFVSRGQRAWVGADERPPLDAATIAAATALLDAEIVRRLPRHPHLVVDPAVRDVALPLTGAATGGFAVLPRGSRSRVDGDRLRFFTYWRQRERRTDFDLSALFLDEHLQLLGHVSYTSLTHDGAVHSGDLTEAPDGATEFIDIPLSTVSARYVVPQVNVYDGEGFSEVAESLFGWMIRDGQSSGAPFEAAAVRTRSELRGSGRVALPIVFEHHPVDGWTAIWMHLHLSGHPSFNQVENNELSTSKLVAALLGRRYLTVGHLVDQLAARAGTTTTWTPGLTFAEPVTFVGPDVPDGLPAGSTTITTGNLAEIIPA